MLIEPRYRELLAFLEEVDEFRDGLLAQMERKYALRPWRVVRFLGRVTNPGDLLREDTPMWVREVFSDVATREQRENPLYAIINSDNSQELLALELIRRMKFTPAEAGQLKRLSEIKGQRVSRFAREGMFASAVAAIGILTKTLPKEVISALGIDYVLYHLVALGLVIIAVIYVALLTYPEVKRYQEAKVRQDRCAALLGYADLLLERSLLTGEPIEACADPTCTEPISASSVAALELRAAT